MKNGEIFYINFNGNKGSEIDSTHLGIVFNIPKVRNMLFCIPLTSPKLKKSYNVVLSPKTIDLINTRISKYIANILK